MNWKWGTLMMGLLGPGIGHVDTGIEWGESCLGFNLNHTRTRPDESIQLPQRYGMNASHRILRSMCWG